MFLTNKQATEEVQREADSLRGLCGADSESRIQDQVLDQEKRYNGMFEDTEERIERCEQAMASLQALMVEVKKFEGWVEEVEKVLEKRREEKRPIGTLQTELDEHYDFMREMETHTEDYCVLVPKGNELMEEYQPNDWLAAVMQGTKDKWFGFVDKLCERQCELVSLLKLWEHYEGEVKELLSWIMAEADSFSKDVTTFGDKGIVDHMETCKVGEGERDGGQRLIPSL